MTNDINELLQAGLTDRLRITVQDFPELRNVLDLCAGNTGSNELVLVEEGFFQKALTCNTKKEMADIEWEDIPTYKIPLTKFWEGMIRALTHAAPQGSNDVRTLTNLRSCFKELQDYYQWEVNGKQLSLLVDPVATKVTGLVIHPGKPIEVGNPMTIKFSA